LSSACIKAGFLLHDYQWLQQKSFTPRQINRLKTIKGDVLITFQKPSEEKQCTKMTKSDSILYLHKILTGIIGSEERDTNYVFMELIKDVLANRIILEGVDFFAYLNSNFQFNNKGLWSIAPYIRAA
jgi:hypothetical protein